MFFYNDKVYNNIEEIKKEFPNKSFPIIVDKQILSDLNIKYLKIDNPPSYNTYTQKIVLGDILYNEEEDCYNQSYNIVELEDSVKQEKFNQLKSAKFQEIALMRYKEETNGVYFNNTLIKTDRDSQATLNGALSAVTLDPDAIIKWKSNDNEWIELNAEQIKELSKIVYKHVQSLFNKEYELSNLIKNASSVSEIKSIEW